MSNTMITRVFFKDYMNKLIKNVKLYMDATTSRAALIKQYIYFLEN